MTKLLVLAEFFKRPKKIITMGYMATKIAESTIDYENGIKHKYNMERLPTIDIAKIIPDLSDQLEVYSFLPNTSMITDLLLLRGLAKRFDKCAYLEIGCHRGESLVAVAGVTNDTSGITLSTSEMKEMGFPQEVIEVQGFFLKNRKDIKLYQHNSQTFDFKSLNKKFDLVFVDGDHKYESIVEDTQNVFSVLRDENSIVVWHDYGITSEIVRHEVLSAILEGTPPQFHKNLYHVSNTMCAVFIKGKFPTIQNITSIHPNKFFTVSVKMNKLS